LDRLIATHALVADELLSEGYRERPGLGEVAMPPYAYSHVTQIDGTAPQSPLKHVLRDVTGVGHLPGSSIRVKLVNWFRGQGL
jgi:hypothetical protein